MLHCVPYSSFLSNCFRICLSPGYSTGSLSMASVSPRVRTEREPGDGLQLWESLETWKF